MGFYVCVENTMAWISHYEESLFVTINFLTI